MTRVKHYSKLCYGKTRFSTWADANRVAGRSRHNGGAKPKPYRCDCCQGYHLGKNVRHA